MELETLRSEMIAAMKAKDKARKEAISSLISAAKKVAIDEGCRVAGATVHLVTPTLDDGPILAQAVVPVLPGDTAVDLAARVLSQEHVIYPKAVLALLTA